jgi:cytochrome c-type biogenesis protein CcmH
MKRGVAAALVAAGVLGAAGYLAWTGMRPPPSAPAARPTAQVVGRIELAAGAALPATPALRVVVYAYALDGPRLPLAVLRRPATELPLDFKLDDSLAPNPAFRLSQAPQLVVGARLGTGDAATAQPGDWFAPPQTVLLGAHGVTLVLQPPRP